MAITTKFETRDDTCRLFKCFFFKLLRSTKRSDYRICLEVNSLGNDAGYFKRG